MKKINFQIEVSRVIEILSNDIYDSPYALLRENIQNAYDAVLMRLSEDGPGSFKPRIDVTMTEQVVTISDNGIGMTEEILENNFWKAGSSGKNNDIARSAGVVGTFGIGAMANFGVASKLEVVSRKSGDDLTLISSAERASLSVTEKCVELNQSINIRSEPGTTVKAILDNEIKVNLDGAIDYLKPYLQYVQVPIYLNETLISRRDYRASAKPEPSTIEASETLVVDSNNVKCEVTYTIQKNGSIYLIASEIFFKGSALTGDIVLSQGKANIYGLRNYFGLAPLPVPNSFNFGGIVNLNNLHPTAGREALSRESINIATHIINEIESAVCGRIHEYPSIDNNQYFLNYIVSRGKYNLANNIKIELKPDGIPIPLEQISQNLHGKKVFFYGGRDQATINTFGNENSYLLHLSQSNPRRKIQHQVLRSKGIEEVPDHPRVDKIIDRKELSLAEAACLLRISSILSDDYLLLDNQINFAEISHQVPSIVLKEGEKIVVYISRTSTSIQQVINCYNTAYEVFGGFVKDFIRNYLYTKLADYIPSSTKQGAEALHKVLQKNRELFKYESTELGDLDSLLSDYVAGEISLPEAIKKSATIQRTHTQSVGKRQVGSAEEEIPSLTASSSPQNENIGQLVALPPIDRTDSKTDKKVLKTSQKYPHLNNFSIFLSLSDRVYKRQIDFFFEPHTTKVIWGMHRIVYIFTHASSNLSLYYDIELKEQLVNDSTGGRPIPTTTIITQDRIFIPVIDELASYFDIHEGRKEFYVRHDIIVDFQKS